MGAQLGQGRGRGAPVGSAGPGVGGRSTRLLIPGGRQFPRPRRGGPGRSCARPRPGAEREPGRSGPGGVGRGREAERGPTQAAAAGSGPYGLGGGWRRKPGGWRGGEVEEVEAGAPFAADSLPRLSRERYGEPAPRSRPPAPGARFSLRAGRGCGRRGRARGPGRPRSRGRCGAPAASALGTEGWVRGIPRGSRGAVGAAPPSPAAGEAVVGPGGR